MRTNTKTRLTSFLLTSSTLLGGLLLSGTALAYEVCVDTQVQNTDSNVSTPNWVTEDYYRTANPTVVNALGYYVRIYKAGAQIAMGFADPSTGCFTFDTAGAILVTDIVVESIAQHGTSHVRAHDGGSDGSSASPGVTYKSAFVNQQLIPNTPLTVTIPNGSIWNAFATASFALSRVSTGMGGRLINMGFDPTESSSSIFPGATDWIEDGVHLIRIKSAGGDDRRRRKFEVVHEMGHAVARLNYGQNGMENFSTSFNLALSPDPWLCGNATSYSQTSVEQDSMGFKEGFANLYVARVFNDRAADGAIWLTGTGISLERFQSANLGNPKGGHLRNHCYSGAQPPHGVSTTEDWTRFLWDVYTIPAIDCGPTNIGLDEMYDLYSATRDANPTVSAHHTALLNAIAAHPALSACEETQALGFADWNAIGGQYHGY